MIDDTLKIYFIIKAPECRSCAILISVLFSGLFRPGARREKKMPCLTRQEIADACEHTEAFLRDNHVDPKDIIRLRINLEEALLRFQDTLGSETFFSLQLGKQLGQVRIRLSVPGPMTDPFAANGAADEEDLLRKALVRMGQLPVWHYSRGQNILLITLSKKKLPEWICLVAAMAGGVLCGLFARQFQGAAGVAFLREFVGPLIDSYLGFLNAVAAPLIFLSVVCGIYSIGDAATFQSLGRKLIRRFAFYLCLITGLTALISQWFFSLQTGEAQGGGFSSLFGLVLDIIPENLFAPFSGGNTLQILFLAVIAGLAMVSISEKVLSVATFTEQLSLIINTVMGVIGKLIPLFIFGSLFLTIADSEASIFGNSGKFFFGTLIASLLILVLYTIFTCIRMRWSPARLWKNAFSTFFIGLTTGSSSASLSDDLKTCKEKYEIDPKLANFAVPLGQIIFKPCNAVMYYLAAVTVAESTDVPVSLSWFAALLIISMVLSASSPPIPGGSTAGFTIMFVQLGLPLENLPVILALNAVIMYIRTATNLFTQQCVLLGTAKRLGMIGDLEHPAV